MLHIVISLSDFKFLPHLSLFALTGGVRPPSLSLLRPRGRLHPLLQPGQPRLLRQHLLQVDPADPSRQPDLSHRSGRDSVRPSPQCGRPHTSGPAENQTSEIQQGQEGGTQDQSSRLCGVFSSDTTQPQRCV